MSSRGVLLVNLGSPASISVRDVRRYLREFLMDGRVLDAPWPIRFFIVHGLILPRRPYRSAEAYAKIWWKEGSPLVVISRRLQAALQARLDLPIELAMRYQQPSIAAALERLSQLGVRQLLLIPLFPHYAMSTFETVVGRVNELLPAHAQGMEVKAIEPYFAESAFVEALVDSASEFLSREHDHLLFSFHGLPERHLRKSDPSGSHCLQHLDCCTIPNPAHATCYRAQCFETVRAFAARAQLSPDKFSVAFQSRLGRQPWLRPYTDEVLRSLPQRGVRKLLVMCPAFVADCLETLEEIGLRGRDTFLGAGGSEFHLVPCLNEHPRWVAALEGWIRRW